MSGNTFIKAGMALLCFLLFLAGTSLAATGLWVILDGGFFITVLPPFSNQFLSHANVGIFSITVGAVMIVLGFLGSCASRKESKCLLMMFFSIVLVICVAEIGATTVTLVFSPITKSILSTWATPGLKNLYGKDQVFTNLWNSTMNALQCCGFSNYSDFSGSFYYLQNGAIYPSNCCLGLNVTYCDTNSANSSSVMGCYKQIVKSTQKNINIVGGIMAGITAVELAAMGMSMYLYCYLDNNTE